MDQILFTQPENKSLQKIGTEAQDSSIQKCFIGEGTICPDCGKGKLEYDGLLNLNCPNCGLVIGGSFT
jgi:uncharacterized protein (DUF983 family)